MSKRLTLRSHVIHKWVGLFAALWLAVLGVTGFILDHRDWNWVWQTSVPDELLTQAIIDESQVSQYRLFQVNPDDSRQLITGGPTGLWWTENGGQNWSKTQFNDHDQPAVFAVFDHSSLPTHSHTEPSDKQWGELWFATSDGVWRSNDKGKTAKQVVLKGRKITSLSSTEKPNTLIGVEDKSRIFWFNKETREVTWQPISPLQPEQQANDIDLSRLVHDLHFGRGLFNPTFDLLWSDITGIALLVLAVSGFLFFWLPKRWRKVNKPARHKKSMIRNLYRVHAIFAGVIVAIPLLYLSITGIILDHSKALRPWLKQTIIPSTFQPPTYRMAGWDSLIYGATVTDTQPPKLLIGSRTGLFQSTDNGQHWQQDKTISGFVWTLRQQHNQLMIGGMGAPNKIYDGNLWQRVPGSGHMPSDMSIDNNGQIYWKSKHGVMRTAAKIDLTQTAKHTPTHIDFKYPSTEGVPLYYLLDGLHTGLLIHESWPWINDLFALCAIILIITGLKRWWRNKWL